MRKQERVAGIRAASREEAWLLPAAGTSYSTDAKLLGGRVSASPFHFVCRSPLAVSIKTQTDEQPGIEGRTARIP
jgi:hypothetical protein